MIVTKLHHHIISIVNIEFVVHTTPTLEQYECSCALSSAQGPTASRSRQLAFPLVVPHHRFVVLRISLCFHALLSQSFGWHWIACLVKMSSKRGLAVRRVLQKSYPEFRVDIFREEDPWVSELLKSVLFVKVKNWLQCWWVMIKIVFQIMVPQQGDLGRSDSPSSSGIPMFGSQLVDKNSSTPYSDATQVRILFEKNI